MVQVDPFLAYGIGAAFALAAPPTIGTTRDQNGRHSQEAFLVALLYLGVLLAPSGLWLLAYFPAWETMQLTTRPPSWLPAVFASGVVLLGCVGFTVTAGLLRRNAPWPAVMQVVWAPSVLCFLLLHGWDGTGLRRFLTATATHGPLPVQPLHDLAGRWITTPVAHTLGTMAAVLAAVLFVLLRRLRMRVPSARLRTEQLVDPGPATAATHFAATVLTTMAVLGGSVASSLALLVGVLGPVLGTSLFLAAALPLLHPRGPLARFLVGRCLPVRTDPAPSSVVSAATPNALGQQRS
ncbi:hypothetical protein [Streptomyces sp. NPDC059166]|uniref:hypothetical protein n=1 Tax=Streptomyces sp. NPDC059166 TaxID=3346752 RepID=UPI0036A66661